MDDLINRFAEKTIDLNLAGVEVLPTNFDSGPF